MQDMQGSPMSAQLAYAQVTAAKPLPEPERRHSDTEGFGSSSLPRAQGLPKPTKVSGLPPRQTPGASPWEWQAAQPTGIALPGSVWRGGARSLVRA
jgi:hypothetical protein